VYGGLVAAGELVVAGGHGPVALEVVDAAFDGMATLVDLGVEAGWPSALGGDVGLDPSPAKVVPVGS